MSSIYRKGRDGYFYYQTYLFDNKTGKKDKKIFHALRTKDKNKAKNLQTKYDAKYKSVKGRKKIKSALQFIIPFLIFALSVHFFTINHNQTTNNLIEYEKIKFKESVIDSSETIPDKQKKIEKGDVSISASLKFDGQSTLTQKSLKIKDVKYSIQKVESLNNSFDQGKISITIDRSIDQELIRKVCNIIKKEYNQFPNIIICVYSNDEFGISLSKGIESNLSAENKKKSWLAMYSFNPVEGEYFDNMPTGYINSY